MKKPTIPLVFLIYFLSLINVFSQSEKINSNVVSFRAKVGSAIEHLGKEKFYKVVTPSESEPPKGEAKRFSKFNQSLGLDAKRVKGEEKFDKAFEIMTEGIQSVVRYEDETYQDSLGTGFIRKVYFNFPLKVVVKNTAGETEKELILFDASEEFFGIFHANMLAQTTAVEGERPVIAFKEKGKMESEYETNKAAIIKRLERNQVGKFFKNVEKAVNAGYGENKFPSGILYSYSLTKEASAANAELEGQCSQLKSALAELNDKAKAESALPKIESSYEYFKKQISAKSDPDLLLLHLGNGAIAALISGHLADADNWFSQFNVTFGNSKKNKVTDFVTLFESLFDLYAPYYSIKQSSAKEIKLNMRLRGIGDKKKNDEKSALKKKEQQDSVARASGLPIYQGDEGKVELTKEGGLNGQFIFHGKIYYNFNETAVNAKGLTVSSPLEIVTAREKMSFPPRQVLYFTVGNKKYMPTAIKTSGLLAVATLATGSLEDPSFWEVLQENDNATFLQFPGKQQFAVKLEGEKEAYEVDDIIKNRKVAKGFFAKCPQLQEAINRKEIKEVTSRDTFKEFYKWLEEHCK